MGVLTFTFLIFPFEISLSGSSKFSFGLFVLYDKGLYGLVDRLI